VNAFYVGYFFKKFGVWGSFY